MSIDHKEEAQRLLRIANHVGGGDEVKSDEVFLTDSDALAAAQVNATLYLAERQRIANLIALCDATWANGSAAFPRLNDAARDAVTREGLGL